MKTPFHSIRWRIQVWYGVLLFLVIAAFCATAFRLAWDNQLRRIDRNLIHVERGLIRGLLIQVDAILRATPDTESVPPPVRIMRILREGTLSLPADASELLRTTEPGYAYFWFRDTDGRILMQSPNATSVLNHESLPATTEPGEDMRTDGNHREMIRTAPEGMVAVVGLDITPEREEMQRFLWSLIAFGLGVWLLGLLGGWVLAGRALKPVAAISRTASRIAAGNLQERINTAGTHSELDQLGHVLNDTFARLHTAFENQRRFTADASHELRTPVTILLSETQRILKRDRSVEEYREAVQTCHDTAMRMRRLTEALLLLAEQEAQGARAAQEPCNLAAIAADAVGQLRPIAAGQEIQIAAELAPSTCLGDPSSLAVLLSNLVRNAIQHNKSGGRVDVRSHMENGHAVVEVSDNGPGIAPEDLPHIFERFYRADKARTSTSGHTGLGLAIAHTIATNHGGTLEAESTLGQGARFVFRIPAANVG